MAHLDHASALYLHGEKTLAVPVKPGLFECCPTMDLIAVVCNDTQVDVYRLNGQRAFAFTPLKATSVITALCWKYNGTSLAVGWEDGSVNVISAETGKVLQHIPNTHIHVPGSTRDAVEAVAALGWGTNFVKPNAIKAKIRLSLDHESGDEEFSLDDFLARLPDQKLLDLDPNLPDQLAALDLEGQFPRLPALAVLPTGPGVKFNANPANEVFASQASVDALFHPAKGVDVGGVDILLRVEADGVTLPILYGSLALRPIRRPAGLAEVLPIQHAYSPFASSHMILAQTALPSTSGGGRHLALLPLTLPFTKATHKHLQSISSKASRVQTLLDYISACLDSIMYHWRQSQDLPAKFMRVISDSLEENQEMALVPSLYHLAATGHCTLTIKEWLTEQLMERGHKRWDHAVNLGYSKIIELTHENLLPAIDRCTMLLSNLRGLAMYYQDTGIFDVPPRRMVVALEALQCLRTLSHHILNIAGSERKQFVAFSKWLRNEIETQGADPAATEETSEQDPGMNHAQVLTYIRGSLSDSKLRAFLSELSDGLPEIPAEDMTSGLIGRNIEALRSGGKFRSYALSLKAHFAALKVSADGLFNLVVEWQLVNSAYHMALLFDEAEIRHSDVCMTNDDHIAGTDQVTTYVATVSSASPSEVVLYCIVHASMLLDQKCIKRLEGVVVPYQGAKVKDVKFADDFTLLALVEAASGETSLMSISYLAEDLPYEDLQCQLIKSSDRHAELLKLERPATATDGTPFSHVRHVFPGDSPFKAGQMVINGRKDRRLIYVITEDRRRYQILDLDGQISDSKQRSEE